jgi:hypothetical protein
MLAREIMALGKRVSMHGFGGALENGVGVLFTSRLHCEHSSVEAFMSGSFNGRSTRHVSL